MSSKTKLVSMALLGVILVVTALLLILDPGHPPVGSSPGSEAEQTVTGMQSEPVTGEVAGEQVGIAGGERQALETRLAEATSITGRLLFEPRVAITGGVVLAYVGKPGDKKGAFSNLMSTLAQLGSSDRPELTMRLTGEPLARAEVEPDGSFLLTGITAPHVRLTLEHDFYGLKQPEPVHVPVGESRVSAGALETYLGAHVTGQLVGPGRGENLIVNIVAEPDPMAPMRDLDGFMSQIFQAGELNTTSDDSGRFEFRALWPSPQVRLLVRSDKYSGRTEGFSLSEGEKREVLLGTQPAISVRALVLNQDDEPVNEARVVLQPVEIRGDTSRAVARRTASTDEAGTCTVTGLWPGSFQAEVTASGYRATGREIEVRSVDGEPELIQFQLDEGGFASGIVVDRQGQPVPDAGVAHVPSMEFPMLGDLTDMVGQDLMARAAEDSPFHTDAEGRFKVTGLQDEGTFHLFAVHDDYVAGSADAQMGDEDVVIELERGGTVRGTVVASESDQPISDFTVESLVSMMMIMERPTRVETVSGADDGHFELTGMAPGSVKLRFRAEGRAEVTRRVQIEAEGELDLGVIVLEPHAVISGQVLDAGGRPVSGATVQRKSGGLADNPILSSMTGQANDRTDEEGYFELAGIVPGRVILLAQARGYASGQSERLTVEAGQVLEDVVIRMGTGGSIAGHLLLGPGESTADWQIMPNRLPSGAFDGGSPRPDGSFRFDNLDPGSYEVQAFNIQMMAGMQSRRDFRPGGGIDLSEMFETINDSIVRVRCTVKEGETTEIELDATELGAPGITLDLGVRLGGVPMADGWAEIRSVDGTETLIGVIDDGNMKLTGLQPGQLMVQVRSGITYTPVGEPQLVEIPEGAQSHQASMDLPGGEIHGRVMNDTSGEALSGTMVRLIREGSNVDENDLFAFALTDEEGGFQFLGLAEGVYGLVAGGQLLADSGADVSSRLQGIRLTGSEVVEGLLLRSLPGAGVTVLVTNQAGGPLAGALLLAVDEDGNPLGSMGLTFTGPDGRAELGGLPEGPLRIVGRSPGLAPGATEMRRVMAGEQVELTLRLGTGPRVTLSITDEQGVKLIGATLSARTQGSPWIPATLLVQAEEPDGTLAIGPVPPGTWEFRVFHPKTGMFRVTREIPRAERASLILSPR